jgi:hypothetical protein
MLLRCEGRNADRTCKRGRDHSRFWISWFGADVLRDRVGQRVLPTIPALAQARANRGVLEKLTKVGPVRRLAAAARLPISEQDRTYRGQNRLPAISMADRLHQQLETVVAPAEEHVLLAFEVAEESSRGDFGLAGDGRDRDRLISIFAIEPHRRFDQCLACALLLSLSKPGADLVQHGSANILHSCKYAEVQHNRAAAGRDAGAEANGRVNYLGRAPALAIADLQDHVRGIFTHQSLVVASLVRGAALVLAMLPRHTLFALSARGT